MGSTAAVSGFPANTAASSFLPNRQRALLRFFQTRKAGEEAGWERADNLPRVRCVAKAE